MANRTDPTAKAVRGTNPQNLMEKIVRTKIYQNTYWKEQCFGLTAETLVDKAMELDHIGGTYGGSRKPTPFMCLVLKMLQIQPEKDIVVEFIRNDDYKYVRILGAFYLRLTGTAADVYRYLEPLYNDYRKLRLKSSDGNFSLRHVDEVINELLTGDYSFDIALPPINDRRTLESLGALDQRKSVLEDDFEEDEEKEENYQDGAENEPAQEKDYYQARSPVRETDRHRRRDSHRYRDRGYERSRDYYSERGCYRDRERDRNRDRDDYHLRDKKEYGCDRERDREREGRQPDRKDRDHGRQRNRSRSPSTRDRKRHDHGSISPRGHQTQDESAREKTNKKAKKDDGTDHPDPEIAEANRIRASLGLKPLRL